MSDFDPDKVRLSTGHFINGQFVSASGRTLGIKRPSDGQHYADIIEADAATVADAVTIADEK
ncbi:aldehyde dehydrogenase family protein, partial [Pantoea allii]